MKRKIINGWLILFVIISIASVTFATDNTKILEQQKTVDISNVIQFDSSIQNQITEGQKDYKLVNVDKQENFKTAFKNKKIEAELIVTTNNRNEILSMFDSTKDVEEEGYKGTLELDIDSLDVKVNSSYTEEYKVYLQKSYTNIGSNELNSIPKTIVQNSITYYLVNPVWEIADVQNIDGGNIPVKYNGTMYYEGTRTRTITRDYLAKVTYTGIIEKEKLDSVTYTLKYEEIEKETEKKTDYTVPVVASGSIIFFSGLILWKRKKSKKQEAKTK